MAFDEWAGCYQSWGQQPQQGVKSRSTATGVSDIGSLRGGGGYGSVIE